MNLVILIGNLGADPEYKVTQSGAQLLNLRLATTEKVKKNEIWEDKTEWHTVTLWGKRAESLSRFLHKGSRISVRGSLRTNSYEKDGEKRYKTSVNADEIELLDRKQGREDSAPELPPPTEAQKKPMHTFNYGADGTVADDDLPF